MLQNSFKSIHGTFKIIVVYYVYINRRSNWKAIVSGQLSDLKSFGLFDEADLYVHVTDPAGIFEDVCTVISGICSDVFISRSVENAFEYPGIRLVYELANKRSDTIFIYLHTKGMSYNIQSRNVGEMILLTGTFRDWRRNIEIFRNLSINKVGLLPAIRSSEEKIPRGKKSGWIWYNFWYARGTYLMKCGSPEVNTNRWYYEDWLGDPHNSEELPANDCHSLLPQLNKTYFTAAEASDILAFLREGVWSQIITL